LESDTRIQIILIFIYRWLFNLVEENSDIIESPAFKEYQTGTRTKIKAPWWWIIIIGIITAIVSLLTPMALNFIIGLYGIPAGFVIALRNKTLSFLVSFRYSSYSAIIFSLFFFVAGVILVVTEAATVGQFFEGAGGFFLSCLIICLYNCFSFGLGALFGTIAAGVIDDRS